MNIERRQELKSRAVDQALGSFVSAILIGFLAWLSGFSEVKYDVNQLTKDMVQVKTATIKTAGDISDMKLQGSLADAALNTRLTVVEMQHQEMLRLKNSGQMYVAPNPKGN